MVPNFSDIGVSPDLPMYLTDLEQEVRRIDKLIFLKANHSLGLVRLIDEHVEDGQWGMRVSPVASFSDSITLPKNRSSNLSLFPVHSECYVLWKGGVRQSVNTMFRDGQGDVGLRKLWFYSAIALVRCRILFRLYWFPRVGLRTYKTIRRHAGLFGETVFAELPRLPLVLVDKAYSRVALDVRLTQALVEAALQQGYDEARALDLLISA